jgi:hypothetical protein
MGSRQSLGLRHSTHSPVAMLQKGSALLQLESERHPPWHLRSAVQVGAVAGQSPLVTHSTHSPWPRAQTGALLEQLPLVTQATQVLRWGSQMGWAVPAQSVLVMQATHAPLAGSHCVLFSQATELPFPHATWQV